jgi:hypothetical protein
MKLLKGQECLTVLLRSFVKLLSSSSRRGILKNNTFKIKIHRTEALIAEKEEQEEKEFFNHCKNEARRGVIGEPQIERRASRGRCV